MAFEIGRQRRIEPQADAAFQLAPPRVARWLAGAIAFLALLSVAEQYVIHIMGRADLEDFLIAVDLDAESNIPTWFASICLLGCAVLFGIIATATKERGDRYPGHWRALSAIFVALSVDEIAHLHEHLGRLQAVWDTHGIFFFAWVIPGAMAVGLVGILFARFLAQLPSPTRRRLILAAVLFVSGALGVEAISGWRAETMGMNNMTHSLIATVEEVLEMSGVACCIVALLHHMAAQRIGLHAEVTGGGQKTLRLAGSEDEAVKRLASAG